MCFLTKNFFMMTKNFHLYDNVFCLKLRTTPQYIKQFKNSRFFSDFCLKFHVFFNFKSLRFFQVF